MIPGSDSSDEAASTASQLFFLDDIRFTNSAIEIETVPAIDENEFVSVKVKLLEVLDASKDTQVTIAFGDGLSRTVTIADSLFAMAS